MIEEWKNHWKDYYKILQVDPSAEPEVIKGAYDKLAKKYHPDVNKTPGANERMKELNEAYETLSNHSERVEYHKVWRQKRASPPPYKENLNPPKPVAEPNHFEISDVPGERRIVSFVVKNAGGPCKRYSVSNPNSWLKVINCVPLYTTGGLPLKVSLLVTANEWGKYYREDIRVRLDNEETLVKVELRTKEITEPVKPMTKNSRRPYTTTHSSHQPHFETSKPKKDNSGLWGCLFWIIIIVIVIILANTVKC
jgi:curved DNA-binding protein CbpA